MLIAESDTGGLNLKIKGRDLTPFSGNFFIILDTNILLNVHRKVFYTPYVLKSMFTPNEDKLWIPKQVWTEYLNNWSGIWKQCKKNLDDVQVNINKSFDKFKIRNAAGLVDSKTQEEIDSSFLPLKETIKSFYSNEKQKYTEQQNIKLKEKIKDWLESKIGNGFKVHEIVKIMEEGEVRYKNIIPPGYRDASKTNGNAFGDLIIWKEIINKAKTENTNIVFVTEDVKDDWNNPRSRDILNQEFKEETGREIQILKLEEYQKYYSPKSASKRISEALAQLDESREKYIKSMEALSKNLLASSVVDIIKQNEQNILKNLNSGILPDLRKILSDDYMKKMAIYNPIQADIQEMIKAMTLNNSLLLPTTGLDLSRVKELLSNLAIEDDNSPDES